MNKLKKILINIQIKNNKINLKKEKKNWIF